MAAPQYETDFYGWTNQQATLLRAGKLLDADIAHIAEEIEDMGKNLKRELVSRLEILFIHLLKWQYQPGHHGNSWRYTIDEQRAKLVDYLEDNPSLKSQLPEAVERGYRYAVRGAQGNRTAQKHFSGPLSVDLRASPQRRFLARVKTRRG